MEAVPRMPMLSFELKQSPEYVDFGPVLKQYIRDHYGEDPAHYNKACTDIEQLRQSVVHVSQDFMGCSTLKKYYAQLQYLQGRFPMGEGGEAAIPFTWEDIHMGREITLADIKFEQASVLYNIGALHSVLGTMETRQNADGMKVSCTHFQCAAWAFEYLRDHYGCAVMSSDMSHDLLTFQVNLMLAQAQECILEKSMIDSRKSTITAKVAAQIVDFYRISIKNLDVCNEEGLVSSRRHKDWKKRMEIKILFYQCITNYYMGRQSEDQQKWGECLAYYTHANTKLQECVKAAKNESSDIQESLRFANDVVGGKYQSAKKDNDFVYHEKIPAIDTLPEVKGASLVKGIPFNPNDPEVSGPDIFQKLVPMEAHEASSLYSEEKAKLLRKVGSDIEEKNQELSQFMSSLQLDPSKLDYEPERLPQQLLEKCAAISVRTNAIKDLVESMGAVSNVATEVDMAIQEIHQLLENEKKEDEEFQAQFGKKSPNTMLPQIKKECDLYEEGHKKGSQSNNDLHKAMNAHIINLKLLAGPLEDLQKALPSMDQQKSPEDEAIVRELQRLLNKVEEMKQQRVMLEEQFRDKVRDDDITNVIVTQEGTNKQIIFDEQLKKHDQVVGYIHQNLAAQDNILQALTGANAKYANMRRMTHTTSSKRESKIRDLINSYDVYEDLLLKSKKGLEFYKKLESNTNRLLDRCKGLCKIEHEEREQILNRLKPKAPPPTRPMAPKPGDITEDKLPNVPTQMVPEQNIPVPGPGAQQFMPSDIPQLPSVIPAGFDGPKLKDYLPFMKPKTFGKDRKTRSKEPSPQPHDDIGAYGSLPIGGVSSPVHLPSGPSSLPGSPHHGRTTGDTGYAQQYSAGMRPDTGQPVYNPVDVQHYPSPSQSPGLQYPSPAHSPALASQQDQTYQHQNTVPQGLQHPRSNIPPTNSIPGPSEHQVHSSYDRTQQIPSSNVQNRDMTNMMGRKEQDGIMSSHGQPYTAHQYNAAYTQPGTPYVPQTQGGNRMPFHPNVSQQPYGAHGATNTVSAAHTPIITPGNSQSYQPSVNKLPPQDEGHYKTNAGVSSAALTQNYTTAMTSSGAFPTGMPGSAGYQQQMGTNMTSAGYTNVYGTPGMASYGSQQDVPNPNQQMTQHPNFSQQQQQPKTGNLPHQVSNQQPQLPIQQLPQPQQNRSSHQNAQPTVSQQGQGAVYQQQQATGQIPTQQAPQGYGNQFSNQQTLVNQQMGQPQSLQQPYTAQQSLRSQQPVSLPTQPMVQNQQMPPSFQQPQQQPTQINHPTYQQQQSTVPQQPVQQPSVQPPQNMQQQPRFQSLPPSFPQQPVQQQNIQPQQQPSFTQQQHIRPQQPTQQHIQPQQIQHQQQTPTPPNQQQSVPSQQYMAHQQYQQQQRPTQIPTQGNQPGSFIQQQQQYPVATSQTGLAQYPGQQQIRPQAPTSQTQGIIQQPQPLQQAQMPLNQRPNPAQLAAQQSHVQPPQQPFIGQLPTQQQQNQLQQIQKQQGQQSQQQGYSSQQQPSAIQPTVGQQNFGQQPQQYRQQQQQPAQGIPFSQGISNQQQYQQTQQPNQTSQQQVVAGSQPSLYQTGQQNVQPQLAQHGQGQVGYQQGQSLNSAQQNQPGYNFTQGNVQGQYTSQPYQGQRSGLQGQIQGQPYQQTVGQQAQQTQRTQVPGTLPTQQWSSGQQPQTQQNLPVSQQPQPYTKQTNPLSPDLLPQPILPSPIKPSSVMSESVEQLQLASLPNQDNTGIYQQPPDNQLSPAKTERKIQNATRPEASVSPRPKLQRQHSGTSTSSSLDDILSSSPEGPRGDVVNNSMLTPKVLTAQEIQQQKEEAMMKNSLSRQISKDPYADAAVRDRFVAEVEKLAKLVESLTKTTCSGPTQLDTLWKELIDEQEKAGRKQSMAIARCYPMKNRETDVMPYDETRVLLTHHKDDYINASYINDLSPSSPKFIATQVPLPATLVDFWIMVYEQGAEVIVMLSSDTETGKMYPEYWPNQKGQVIHHGPITLNLQSVKDKQFWIERIIYLNHVETKQGRTIVQLQYKHWPVSGFPDKVSYVLQFITEVHSFYRQQRSLLKPVVVHCSTGIGRTGTFFMIYTGMQEIDHGNGIISIQDVAKKMILRRRNAIREKSQLKYCYDAILFYAQDVLATRGILIRKASFGDRIPHPGEKSNQWTPSEDVVFGSMSINTLQSSLSNLHAKNVENTRVTLEKTNIQEKIVGETELPRNTVSKFSSLPDVVQRTDSTSQSQLIDTTDSSHHEVKQETTKTATGSTESLTKIGTPKLATGSMESLTKIGSPKMGSRSGSNASLLSDGSVGSGSTSLEGSPFHKPHVPQAPDVPQCLADLQDPKTFTLGKESGKKKISKKDFTAKSSSILQEHSDSSDDPLNSLDPLWSLNKGQK